jgi:hypothetical protein
MTELFEEDEKIVTADDEVIEAEVDIESPEEPWSGDVIDLASDARRRLENMLDERKLRDELDDYFDLDELNSLD